MPSDTLRAKPRKLNQEQGFATKAKEKKGTSNHPIYQLSFKRSNPTNCCRNQWRNYRA